MPTISVVIPTYNRGSLLRNAIQSVLNQTFKDIEIIIIDDASSEDIKKIVESFNNDPILYTRHESNRGASCARNTGIMHSSSEYIAFLDSDDEWFPFKLEKQLDAFRTSSAEIGMVYTNFCDTDEPGKKQLTSAEVDINKEIFSQNIIGTTSTPMIRKKCFNEIGGFDESLPSCQDWDMWIRICMNYKCKFIDQVLAKYSCQKDSITNNKKSSINGHKMIIKKYKNQIDNLDDRLKLNHYIYVSKIFYWRGAFFSSIYFFIKAFLCKARLRGNGHYST